MLPNNLYYKYSKFKSMPQFMRSVLICTLRCVLSLLFGLVPHIFSLTSAFIAFCIMSFSEAFLSRFVLCDIPSSVSFFALM